MPHSFCRVRSSSRMYLTTVLLSVMPCAYALDSLQEVIVTPSYEKSMRTSDMMRKIDANADGKITMEEGEAYFRKVFAALDANHDGVLDRTEWKGASKSAEVVSLSTGGYARALSSMEMMKLCDADRDRKVTELEFLKVHQTLFQHMARGEAAVDATHWLDSHNPISG